MSPAPTTQAHPVVDRSRLANRMRTPLAITRPQDGRSITPRRAKILPTVRHTLQARSSLKTKGVAARSIQIVPPMMVAIKTPNAVASALPITESPRTRNRTRHSSSEANSPVSSQARSMYVGVSLPSRLLVTSRMGMRMIEGNSPK